jgi:cytochrome c553
MFSSRLVLVTAAAALLVAGCSKGSPKPDAARAATPAPVHTVTAPAVPYVSEADARKAFLGRCASCHGMEGKGDGPGATSLNPKPRNYTDKEWQKTVTDDQIGKTILYGGAAIGKSPIMPANPDLGSKPEMITALVKIVRGFGQ